MCLRWSKTTSTSESISAMSGSPSGSGLGGAKRLDGAHEVVAEEARPRRPRTAARPPAAPGGSARRAPRRAHSGSPPSLASDQRSTERGRKPMNDQRPKRWPCSADSSRNAGSLGASARSFRNAETGVSQSSMNCGAAASGCSAVGALARARARASVGSSASPVDARTGQRRRASSTRSASASGRPRLRSSTSRW